MAEFRTASGLVSCDVYVRTATGLVQVDPQFRTATGLVDCGSGSSLSVTVDKTSTFGAIDSPSPSATATTDYATAAGQGGTPPYSYLWVSQDSNLTPTNPTAAASAFRGTAGPGDSLQDTFVCTVTDARGVTANSDFVSATISNFNNKGAI